MTLFFIQSGEKYNTSAVAGIVIHAELALNVDGKQVSITADGAIPEDIQKKYDQISHMAVK